VAEQIELESPEVVAEGLAFPEGPVAFPDGSVVLVEIAAGRVTRVEPDGDVTLLAQLEGGPNGAAVGPDGGLYICNNGGLGRQAGATPCIQRLDLGDGSVDVLYTESGGRPLRSPNDIVFDDKGGFWFTDLGGGAIHYATPDGKRIETAIYGLHSPNGIGLSPSGDVLYWAETLTRQVHRRRLDGPGSMVKSPNHDWVPVSRGRQPDPWTFILGLPGRVQLDSLAVEASGSVCVGTLVEGGVTVVDPDTGTYSFYTHPILERDGAVTNICFGGDDMSTAYITCSGTGLLVRCRWPRAGLPLHWLQAR
jgi:gluconolactonase